MGELPILENPPRTVHSVGAEVEVLWRETGRGYLRFRNTDISYKLKPRPVASLPTFLPSDISSLHHFLVVYQSWRSSPSVLITIFRAAHNDIRMAEVPESNRIRYESQRTDSSSALPTAHTGAASLRASNAIDFAYHMRSSTAHDVYDVINDIVASAPRLDDIPNDYSVRRSAAERRLGQSRQILKSPQDFHLSTLSRPIPSTTKLLQHKRVRLLEQSPGARP